MSKDKHPPKGDEDGALTRREAKPPAVPNARGGAEAALAKLTEEERHAVVNEVASTILERVGGLHRVMGEDGNVLLQQMAPYGKQGTPLDATPEEAVSRERIHNDVQLLETIILNMPSPPDLRDFGDVTFSPEGARLLQNAMTRFVHDYRQWQTKARAALDFMRQQYDRTGR